MRRLLLFLSLLLLAPFARADTNDNDASCDIGVYPAATLLLPYFEVDLEDPNGETTLFTITNVTNVDQIAHVTLWTDRSFPVFSFNVYLTGYDVQAINLFDVINRGVVAPDAGTGTTVTKRGQYSDPNPSRRLIGCERLPGPLDQLYVERMQDAFLLGSTPDLGILEGCGGIGGQHEHAVGYATIDVVRTCTTHLPTDAVYWTDDIAFDNALTGDYQQLNSHQNFAQGGPLVHIRAVPEGGTARERRLHQQEWDVPFERTFYSRYQARTSPTLDGRQPLPSTFAARWIHGSGNEYATSMKVWREGRTGIEEPCASYAEEELPLLRLVAFDENENAVSAGGTLWREFPATSRTDVSRSDIFPELPNGAGAGWMYFDLDASRRDDFASQAWVISSMRALGRYSADVEAVALGNACARPAEEIAPAKNEDSCDIALLPAATLLLPYFEVDVEDARGETTLFTVTNVSPAAHIARVTLWTDYAFPVLAFNLRLDGYDVEAINLFDVLANGRIGSEGLERVTCGPSQLEDAYIQRMQAAFTQGIVPDLGDLEGCNNVGNEHDNAVGYATIDVVRNCDSNVATSADYWTRDLAYDNVLIGDYQQVNPTQNFAQGNPMVHIRAVDDPDRTFYRRYQSATAPKRDRRQPLPSTFAARWIQGGAASFQTSMKIWREPTAATTSCALHDDAGYPKLIEVARFDEAEYGVSGFPRCRCTPIEQHTYLPATSLTSVTDDDVYPQLTNGAVAGWIYFNLDNSAQPDEAGQSWVVVSMRAQGRYSVDFDATALGNGCSPPVTKSEMLTANGPVIGPAGNVNP